MRLTVSHVVERPATELQGDVGASLWEPNVGDSAKVTLQEVLEFALGTRGWSAVSCQVIDREVRTEVGDWGGYISMRLKAYSPDVCHGAKLVLCCDPSDLTAHPSLHFRSPSTVDPPTLPIPTEL